MSGGAVVAATYVGLLGALWVFLLSRLRRLRRRQEVELTAHRRRLREERAEVFRKTERAMEQLRDVARLDTEES